MERLLQFVEMLGTPDVVKQRAILQNAQFWFPFEVSDDLVQLQVTADVLLTSSLPLPPVTSEPTDALQLPNLGPAHPLVSLNEENIYQIKNIYRKCIFFLKIGCCSGK